MLNTKVAKAFLEFYLNKRMPHWGVSLETLNLEDLPKGYHVADKITTTLKFLEQTDALNSLPDGREKETMQLIYNLHQAEEEEYKKQNYMGSAELRITLNALRNYLLQTLGSEKRHALCRTLTSDIEVLDKKLQEEVKQDAPHETKADTVDKEQLQKQRDELSQKLKALEYTAAELKFFHEQVAKHEASLVAELKEKSFDDFAADVVSDKRTLNTCQSLLTKNRELKKKQAAEEKSAAAAASPNGTTLGSPGSSSASLYGAKNKKGHHHKDKSSPKASPSRKSAHA